MKHILISAFVLGTMSSVALAAPLKLTPTQLDTIAAGKRAVETEVFLGSSDNVCTTNCDVPGRTTDTTSGPPGQIINQDNLDCNNCDTVSTGPGNSG
jgi:hypothetical protein